MLSRYRLTAATALAASFCALAGCDQATTEAPTSLRGEGVPVELAAVRAEVLRETVRGIGTLQAAETVEIKPEIDGFISDIPCEEGAAVRDGELLFLIDARKLRYQLDASQAALDAARVRLADAERRFRRLRELVERGSADRDELDGTETEARAAAAEVSRTEAEVELAQARLDDARLAAPFDGIISERAVDIGDYVKAGDHLATVYRISQMEIGFTLPERFIGRVQPRQKVAVSISAFPNRQFDGEVYFVSPRVDESTRDFLVKATVDNQEGLLKPGAFGTAVVTLEERTQRPAIPEEALVATREGYLVFVVEDQVAHRRDVRVGLRETGLAEIVDGLELGEQIVRLGQMNLSDGTPIRIVQGDEQHTHRHGQSAGTPSETP